MDFFEIFWDFLEFFGILEDSFHKWVRIFNKEVKVAANFPIFQTLHCLVPLSIVFCYSVGHYGPVAPLISRQQLTNPPIDGEELREENGE